MKTHQAQEQILLRLMAAGVEAAVGVPLLAMVVLEAAGEFKPLAELAIHRQPHRAKEIMAEMESTQPLVQYMALAVVAERGLVEAQEQDPLAVLEGLVFKVRHLHLLMGAPVLEGHPLLAILLVEEVERKKAHHFLQVE